LMKMSSLRQIVSIWERPLVLHVDRLLQRYGNRQDESTSPLIFYVLSKSKLM